MSVFSAENVSELDRFWREMAPVPRRMATSLRFALTSALATLALLILQPPAAFIAPSLFMLFLISRETPHQTLKDLLTLLSGAMLGATVTLLLMIVTDDHPVARVVGLAFFTFIAAFFFRTSVVPAFPMAFGCLTYMVISLWEYRIRAERILHLSLWPLGVLATVAGSAVVVEYLFNRSDPLVALRRELKARCGALERLFHLYATHAEPAEIERQSSVVWRYSVTGVGQLHVLLERVSKEKAGEEAECRTLRAMILSLDRALILAAGVTLDHGLETVQDQARFERIKGAITAAKERRFPDIQQILRDSQSAGNTELDRVEQTMRHLGDSGMKEGPPRPPSSRVGLKESLRRLLLPDAFNNDDYFMYALKISLCATICYVIYNGLGWPGISTAFFTVYFTGLSTTGTTNRKLLLRVIGSTVGGMILGIGCLVFVFPNIEGVQGFLLVVAALSFIGAWAAGSPHFGYLGLQITFSFNLLAFERLRAPDQMTPARDRLLGIALGFLIMFLIFHQVRPERTVDTMRRLLARLLRTQADLIQLFKADTDSAAEKIAGLKQQIAALSTNLQNFAHAVKFEFPPDRAPNMRLSNEILSAAGSAGDLLVCVQTWPLDADTRTSRLTEIRDGLEVGLRQLARSLEQASAPQEESAPSLDVAADQESGSGMPICVARAMDNYRELRMACEGILKPAA